MRNSFIILTFICSNLLAQATFTATDIATSADGAMGVFLADLDNDGDLDVISAAKSITLNGYGKGTIDAQ